MADLTIYPDADPESTTVDGYVANETQAGAGNGVTWANIRDSAQIQAATPSLATFQCQIHGHQDTDKWQGLFRTILLFDLSAIGDPIHGLTLTIKGHSKSDGMSIAPDINVYESAPATNTNLIGADTDTILTTPLCDTPIAYADWDVAPSVANAPNDFVLNAAGIALANAARVGDGILKIALRNANYDVANIEPTWSNTSSILTGHSADRGGEFRPKLVVTHGYPTHPLSRVTGMVHRRSAGRDSLEILTGNLAPEPVVPFTFIPDTAVPQPPPIIIPPPPGLPQATGLIGGEGFIDPVSGKRYWLTSPNGAIIWEGSPPPKEGRNAI